MPGVTTTTAVRSGPASDTAPAEARYFCVGQFDRGLVGSAVQVRSVAELEYQFGTRVTYGAGYDDLRTYFEEGGAEAYVSRVVGPAATKGTLMLQDKAGSPLNTLKIDAISAGAWSADVTVAVAAGTLGSNYYRLTVQGPVGDPEVYDNLATPADGETALTKSAWVRGTNQGSATAAPNNNPKILAATALSAGSDDRASITATHHTNALSVFGPELGTGCFGVPGQAAATVSAACIAHAKTYSRLWLAATAVGQTDTQARTAAAGLLADGNDCAGLFWPWVKVPLGGGATKLISPEGFVAGKRARKIIDVGVWEAPAGEAGIGNFIVGLEVETSKTVGDQCNAANVNVIRTVAGKPRLYGWRSLSPNTQNFYLLTSRDLLDVLRYQGEAILEPFVFKSIDGAGKLLGRIKGSLVALAEGYRRAGGLFELIDQVTGKQIDPGYSVDVGPSINTLANLQGNRVAAQLAVRPPGCAETIALLITKADLTAAV